MLESRRDFLKKSALLPGAAGVAAALLESIKAAEAIEPAAGSTFWDAEHIVILMQENRSFDHAFGTLRGVRGFDDPRALTLPDGNPVWVQTDDAGRSFAPFRLNIKDTCSTWTGCLPHNWTDQVDARNGGLYDRWLEAKRSGETEYAEMPLTLGYYDRDDIPFYYALADAFTICDQHFCSSLTGTTPNRLHLWTGTIRAEQHANSKANVLNEDADYACEVNWKTFPERLEDLGISWKIYQNEVWVGVGFEGDEDPLLANFGDNPIEYFSQFKVRFHPAHRAYLEAAAKSLPNEIAALKAKASRPDSSPADREKLQEKVKELEDRLSYVEKERLTYNETNYAKLTPQERNLQAKAFSTNTQDPHYHELEELTYDDNGVQRRVEVPKGDLFHQFRRDVAEDKLPTVSWVVAPERFSDHPCSAWYGAWYIAELLNILTQNPAVWRKTIFLLTYDENDGYFDHVPPFVAPHPKRPETGRVSQGIDTSLEYVERKQELKYKSPSECRDSPIGLGYRVPLVIASPWTRGGWVCSQVFDHTSPLQFLEKFLTKKTGREVSEPNINAWRRTVCGDLTSAFRPADETPVAPLPFPQRDAFVEGIHRAKFCDPPNGYTALSAEAADQIRREPMTSPHLPRQETGVRPSCALPYELDVHGQLSEDRERFQIRLTVGNQQFGDLSAGAPFIVYSRHGDSDVRVRNYAVTPGDVVEDSWELADFRGGRYHLSVYGPNGYFREYRGQADEPKIEMLLSATPGEGRSNQKSGNSETKLTVRIHGGAANVEIIDRSYGQPPQRLALQPGTTSTVVVDTGPHFGWYDFGVRIEGDAAFERRFAGRIETGRPSFSDPAIGRSRT